MDENRNYAWPETSINLEDLRAFDDWYTENSELIGKYKIIIWGAGIRGAEFQFFFRRKQNENILFTDSDSAKWGGNINGILIISPDEAKKMLEEKKAKVLISVENYKDIEKKLSDWMYKKNYDFFIAKTDLYKNYVREFKRIYECENLFMGDCLFSTISINDVLTIDLKRLFIERLGRERCKVLAMHGISMSSMYYIFKLQIKNGMKPNKLILEINPEMMTGKQHLLPRSQHEEMLRSIHEEMDCTDQEFEQYLKDVKERSNNYQIEFWMNNKSDKDRRGINAANYFKLNYMYKFRAGSEAALLLRKALQLAKQNNVSVIGFIPPVNYMYAEKIFGSQFFEKYDELRKQLEEIVAEEGSEIIDFSYQFKSEEFSEPDSSSETLNEVGRKKFVDLMMAVIEGR